MKLFNMLAISAVLISGLCITPAIAGPNLGGGPTAQWVTFDVCSLGGTVYITSHPSVDPTIQYNAMVAL